MNESRLVGLFLVFAPLSLMSFGGGQAIIADMQHQTVDIQHWMSGRDFVDIFAISRAAPGPSTLIAALIGWHIAGFGARRWRQLRFTCRLRSSSMPPCGGGMRRRIRRGAASFSAD